MRSHDRWTMMGSTSEVAMKRKTTAKVKKQPSTRRKAKATKKKTRKKKVAKTKKAATKMAPAATTNGGSLSVLLKGKPPTSFTATALLGKAHWRWNKDQLFEAYLLFDAATERAQAEGDASRAQAAANRAAITLFRSRRDPNAARARLRGIVTHYRDHPDDVEDRHFVDWAMTALLEDVAERTKSAAAFRNAYRAGVAEVSPLLANEWSTPPAFPRIGAERIIDAAKRVGAHDIVAELEGDDA